MDEHLKQRLVGAAVLVSLVVVVVPMLFDPPPVPVRGLPPPVSAGRVDEEFSSRIIPLDEPATPVLDRIEARRRQAVAEASAPVVEPEPARAERPAPAAPEPQRPVTVPEVRRVTPEQPAAGAGPAAWVVQLGSFSNKRNAMALRDRLHKKGYTAFVESAYSDRGAVTRVYVGPELDREAARSALEKLERDVKLRGLVVRHPG